MGDVHDRETGCLNKGSSLSSLHRHHHHKEYNRKFPPAGQRQKDINSSLSWARCPVLTSKRVLPTHTPRAFPTCFFSLPLVQASSIKYQWVLGARSRVTSLVMPSLHIQEMDRCIPSLHQISHPLFQFPSEKAAGDPSLQESRVRRTPHKKMGIVYSPHSTPSHRVIGAGSWGS